MCVGGCINGLGLSLLVNCLPIGNSVIQILVLVIN